MIHRLEHKWQPLVLFFFWCTPNFADVRSVGSSAASRHSQNDQKVRISFLSQTMSPTSQDRIPDAPSPNSYSSQVLWIRYDLSEDTRIGYWQRSTHYFQPTSMSQEPFLVLRNPRFELEKIDFWKTSRWKMSYHLYVQPGLTPEARPLSQGGSGKSLEEGIRTYQSFLVNAKWTAGLITETTHATSFQGPPLADFYGSAILWIDRFLSDSFSQQHYFTLNFQHLPNTSWYEIAYQYPLPWTMQNGITYHWNRTNTLSLLVTHCLKTWPTFKNASLTFWITLNLL
jgi:hypothetical protein